MAPLVLLQATPAHSCCLDLAAVPITEGRAHAAGRRKRGAFRALADCQGGRWYAKRSVSRSLEEKVSWSALNPDGPRGGRECGGKCK